MKRLNKKALLAIAVAATALFLSGCQSVENQTGFFYGTFVRPMEWFLEFFSNQTGGSYGWAIIIITVIVRFVLMPFMLRNYKSQQQMKVKMDALRPEMEEIQAKLKDAKARNDQEALMKLQQEMMGLYSKHGVNPLNMGCLPLLIQMPIIMGLYFAILYSPEVKEQPFLWFNLGETDIAMTLLAGLVYFVQARISLWTMPEQQQQQMKFMIYFSPIMIMVISFNVMAALPLYWTVSGLLLVLQTVLGRLFYAKEIPAKEE